MADRAPCRYRALPKYRRCVWATSWLLQPRSVRECRSWFFLAIKAETFHDWCIGNPQQQCVLARLMEMRPPSWSGNDIAAAPFKPLTVDRRCAGSSDRGVDIVCGGLVWRSFGARSESHHEQTDRIHRRIAELHLGAKPA